MRGPDLAPGPGAQISGSRLRRCPILYRASLELAEEWRLWPYDQRPAHARGHACSGLSGFSGGDFHFFRELRARRAGGAGRARPCHLLRHRAHRRPPRSRGCASPRRARRALACGALPVYRELRRRRDHRNPLRLPDGPRRPRTIRRISPCFGSAGRRSRFCGLSVRESLVPRRNPRRFRSAGAPRNASGAPGRRAGAGRPVVAAARLAQAPASRCADGRRARAAASALGRAQLAHVARSTIPRAALQRAAW